MDEQIIIMLWLGTFYKYCHKLPKLSHLLVFLDYSFYKTDFYAKLGRLCYIKYALINTKSATKVFFVLLTSHLNIVLKC